MNAIEWVGRLDEIIVDAEVTTTDYISSKIADRYFRLDLESKGGFLGQFDTDKDSILMLELEAEKLLRDKKEHIEKLVREILDEKHLSV